MMRSTSSVRPLPPGCSKQYVPLEWYPRYGLRSDQARLPKDTSKREALARQIGMDGYELLDWVVTAESPPGLRDLPALEALRQIWVQQYYRCTGWALPPSLSSGMGRRNICFGRALLAQSSV
jgi:transposase